MLSHSSQLLRSRSRQARDIIHLTTLIQSRNASVTARKPESPTSADDTIERFEKAVDIVNRGAKGLPYSDAVDPWMRSLELFGTFPYFDAVL